MDGWLMVVTHWHWLALAVVLLILEVTVPAFFFLWMGIGAALVGIILYFFPELSWKGQLLWFSGFSLLSIGAWHGLLRKRPTPTDQPMLNRRGSQYIGRVFNLDAPIENGIGKVRVDDTHWKVRGPEMPQGGKVRVTGVDGVILVVEAVE